MLENALTNHQHISKKKTIYPINDAFRKYLKIYSRDIQSYIKYAHLREYDQSFAYYDSNGKDTLWETVLYPPSKSAEIHQELKRMYAFLKTGGDMSSIEHLIIERIDFCAFGNTNPFRIKIVNTFNDVYDYFYIKQADASRAYGLEIEHLLAPDKINFLVNSNTLIEEHIPGIPGDIFIKNHLMRSDYNPKKIAKEFVKFNERCFIRLLGDMRAYNYVFDITPDFDNTQIRIRAIDFDQQCYEGNKNVYLPQFFKENSPLVKLCLELLPFKTIQQYQQEEKAIIARRILGARQRIKDLLHAMERAELSQEEKIISLRNDLSEHYQDNVFQKCDTMGMLFERSIKRVLVLNFKKNFDW